MARRARGQGTVYKESGDRRATKWRAEKTVELRDGRRRRIVARARTQDEAIKKLTARERTALRNDPSAEDMTLWQYLERWLESQAGSWKPRTLREYTATLAKVRDPIGDLTLTRVRPIHIQEVIDAEIRAKRYGAAANLRRYLRQALRQAERWELLESSPARNIRPVDRPPPKRGVLQPPQIRMFLQIAEEVTPTYRPIFYAAIFSGLRLGELVALPWSNVTRSAIRVDRAFDPDDGQGATKSPAGEREVPIRADVYSVIRAGRSGPRSSLAFPSGAGTMLTQRNVSRAFRRVIEKSHEKKKSDEYIYPVQLPEERTFHDLRRTAATLWAMQGATPKMIQRFLGHATPHLALAIYTEVMDEQLVNAALDPSAVLGGGESGGSTMAKPGKKRDEVDE